MLKQKRIYIALPVEQIQIPLIGIADAQITENLRDLWSIEFEIDKQVDGELNLCYSRILPLTQIFVDGIGWFILPVPPEEHDDGNRIYKSFTAVGIEQQLQQETIIDLQINTGDYLSREQYDENLDTFGVIIRSGRLWIADESDSRSSDDYWELGLLNILQREYLSQKGWSIGHVDSTLAAKRGRTFSFTSSNAYAIITQDIPKAFRCLPVFDRINKTVSFYELSNVGTEHNLEFSFRNFINDVARTNQKDEFYTRLKVSGGNDTTSIAPYNFGSEYVEDYDYLIEEGVIDDTLAQKIRAYNTYKDSRRQDYTDAYIAIANAQAEIDRLQDLHPIDAVRTSWNAYTIPELQEERYKWTLLDNAIVEKHGGDNLQPYDPDYPTLRSIRKVIIPDIDKEIQRQADGSQTNFEHINYKIIWELYGISELEISKKNYENSIRTLAAKGYDHPWQEGDSDDQGSHDRNYQTYLTYVGYVSAINSRLALLNDILQNRQAILDSANADRATIADDVKITHQRFGFTTDDIQYINYLRIDCDYKDSSIEVIDPNDYSEVSHCAVELYNSAKEQAAITSRPQRHYEFATDNPFLDEACAKQLDGLTVGDFLYFELDNKEKLKQRVTSITYNLADMNDIAQTIIMSDMTALWGVADDWRFLLESGSGVSASSINNTSSNRNYISGIAYSAASEAIVNYFGGGGGGGNVIVAGLSDEDILVLADKLSGLVEGTIDVDELTARFATIEQLQAEHLYAGTIDAALGSFQQLTATNFSAVNADIGLLDADVGNISSLLAGNAGTGTLTAIHITSQNVVVDNAVIKSAMIDSISADKINSGTVNTNNVTIASSDGGIQISGNTQQWTDGNGTVRMQAGQDAQGNFNFAVFGADGTTTYLDETGIHSAAVPNGLMVDRMVANNANIAASKLNIESLFNVINNDNSHTINTTKIWVDEENQSLGAKLSSLTTGIEDNADDISTLTSEYTVLNGQVQSNITATQQNATAISTLSSNVTQSLGEISTTLNSVSAQVDANSSSITSLTTQTSAVTQDLNGFKLTVSNTYQTQTAAQTEQQRVNTRLAEIEEAALAGNLDIEIDSSAGNIFKNSGINTILTAHAFFRGQEVTSDIPSWTWKKHNADGTEDTSWTRTNAGNIITITPADVDSKAVFYAEATYTTS